MTRSVRSLREYAKIGSWMGHVTQDDRLQVLVPEQVLRLAKSLDATVRPSRQGLGVGDRSRSKRLWDAFPVADKGRVDLPEDW